MVSDHATSNTVTRAGVGLSQRAVIASAVSEVLEQALAALNGQAPIVAIVYSGIAHDQAQLHAALRKHLPAIPIVGASTQGACVRGRSVETERFLAVALLASPSVTVRVGAVSDIRGDTYAAGRALAEQLGAPADTEHVTLLFYDPLGGADADALVRGLGAGGYRIVYGGASGQPWGRMYQTYQLWPGGVHQHGAVAVDLVGLKAVADLTHGAESTGLELTVTRAERNVVYELDGRPALDVWCEQLGVLPDQTVENTSNWALGVRPTEGTHYEGLITRAPFVIDPAARAVVLQAPVAVGARVQVCIRTQPAVYDGALAMAERLRTKVEHERPVLALGFECGARPGPFLGAEMAQRENNAVQRRLPDSLPWFGMYAWGEIAPVGARTEFHNFTFPLCLLCAP